MTTTDERSRRAIDQLEVELIAWPSDAARRDVLARAAVPRILLIADGCSPPSDLGLDEDWVRMPALDDDIVARAEHLLRSNRLHSDQPFVDESRVLHRAGRTVLLTAAEARVLSLLLQRVGTLVEHRDLEQELWHGPPPSADALNAVIYRLRRRLGGLAMNIRAVRGQGFVLFT